MVIIGPSATLAISEARERARGWAKECELDEAALAKPLDELERSWSEAAAILRATVALKMENPVNAIEPTREVHAALSRNASALTDYNEARDSLTAAGTAIDARMTALGAMRRDEIEQRLLKLRNTKKRHSKPVDAVCARLHRLERGKRRVDLCKDAARDQGNRQMDRLLTQYQG